MLNWKAQSHGKHVWEFILGKVDYTTDGLQIWHNVNDYLSEIFLK